jgi:hypothetical protein
MSNVYNILFCRGATTKYLIPQKCFAVDCPTLVIFPSVILYGGLLLKKAATYGGEKVNL